MSPCMTPERWTCPGKRPPETAARPSPGTGCNGRRPPVTGTFRQTSPEETVTGTTHTITGLTDGVEYAVGIIAANDVGEGPAVGRGDGNAQGHHFSYGNESPMAS